jgi:formylglycine-generating enzyme required for sulfatase activity
LLSVIALITGCRIFSDDDDEGYYPQTATQIGGDYTSANIGTLKYFPAGTFQRDSTAANKSTVSSFRMSQYEITRKQFSAIMCSDPIELANSSGVTDPVQMVNWYHAIAFCNKLSLAEGLTPVYTVTGVDFSALTYAAIPTTSNTDWDAATCEWSTNGYRLPTEMEWMWAAMGADQDSQPGAMSGGVNVTGYAKTFAGYNGSNSLDAYAWYSTNSSSKTHPVGTKLANELGLHDMSGNVTVARRNYGGPGNQFDNIGFRVVRPVSSICESWQPVFFSPTLSENL